MSDNIDRRNFLKNTIAATALAGLGYSVLVNSCGKSLNRQYDFPELLEKAPDGTKLKAGLVGCGSRGTGAAINFLNAGNNLEITSIGDLFQDKIDSCRESLLKEKNVTIADEKCFIGFDAFEKVIDSGVDIVLLATPPKFRPEHFEACVKARKHVFLEKPVAVDPIGVRSILINAEKANSLGLCVVAGTIYRHQRDYIENFKQVISGTIGEITSANCYYNVGKLWHRNPQPEWSEMEMMIRDWVNWSWLSGDHIVEQHVHNLDIMNWFIGGHPVKALGVGARHRRLTGDQYDFFSVDFTYENNVHLHSMCRQINGCSNSISDYIRGTEGYTNCKNTIFKPDNSIQWKYEYPADENGKPTEMLKINSYDQEHVDFVTAIRNKKPVNEAKNIAESTLTGIMGRISAYTGKEVTWDEVLNLDLYLGPKVFVMGKVDYISEVPKPGI